jgi:hypothetical protein
MSNPPNIETYNYDSFIPKNFLPFMRFDKSPAIGEPAPDYPLWDLDKQETSLSAIWKSNDFTIVEFGSFT